MLARFVGKHKMIQSVNRMKGLFKRSAKLDCQLNTNNRFGAFFVSSKLKEF